MASISDDRYHHGKLYEWVSGGRRETLTGSPNLSVVALCRAMTQGANCELGLVAEVEESLAPALGSLLGVELATHPYPESQETNGTITLLGATCSTVALNFCSSGPSRQSCTIEAADGNGWNPVESFPEGQIRHTVSLPTLEAGSALRLCVGAKVSNTVFVLDPSRVLRTRIAHEGRVLTNEDDVFADPAVAEAFLEDVAALRRHLQDSGTRGIVGHGERDGDASQAKARGPIEFQSWEEYLDACASLVGQRLLDFAFGLPRLGLANEAAPTECVVLG